MNGLFWRLILSFVIVVVLLLLLLYISHWYLLTVDNLIVIGTVLYRFNGICLCRRSRERRIEIFNIFSRSTQHIVARLLHSAIIIDIAGDDVDIGV